MGYVSRLPQNSAPARVGGKAYTLMQLARAGFAVPEGFVLDARAFVDSLTPDQRDAVESGADPERLRSALAGVVPSPAVRRELAAALVGIGDGSGLLAVRSSAPDEDGRHHSFAGQLKSFLYVRAEELAARVADVWRSGFDRSVYAYRAEHGLPLPPSAPAVLVQCMIDPDAAGVAFSADPVTGNRSLALVASAFGAGSAVVSDEADSDLHRVDGCGRIVKRRIACKRWMHRAAAGTPGGVGRVPVPEAQAKRAALSDAQVRRVAHAARSIEALLGTPQDIEWAFRDDRLHILQARPITTLRAPSPGRNDRQIWDNSNIVESYGGITTPLTFSFARRAYEGVYRQFCRTLRVPPGVVAENGPVFVRMIGLIRGRVYYNLLNWYRLIALLPGYASNRRFMEQMMGVREPADPNPIGPPRLPLGARVRDLLHLGTAALNLLTHHLLLRRRAVAFQCRLEDALGEGAETLHDATPDELVSAFRDLERRLLTRWDAPIVNDFLTMIFSGILGRLCSRWGMNANGPVHQALLCSGGRMISTEPLRRLAELARLAAAEAGLPTLLAQADSPDILRRLRRYPEFHLNLRMYLKRFGERCTDELKLESETLLDDPLPLLHSIGALAARPPGGASMNSDGLPDPAEDRVRAALLGHPLRRLVFNWILRNARERVRMRENLRYERTRVFGRVRTLFLEMGRRFHERGLLDHPRDIFYLEVEEVFGFVQGYATCTDLKGLVALRRREFDSYAASEAPASRFETIGPVHHGNRFRPRAQRPSGDAGQEVRRGIGCGPGVATGPARVVADPRTATVASGDILVAERTDPGWVTLFPLAAGLVVERGSLLSHSAIVAREMGLPTVVGLEGAGTWLRTGDPVTVDGNTGCVWKLAGHQAEASDAVRN
jgi:pyruvate,water dikinase